MRRGIVLLVVTAALSAAGVAAAVALASSSSRWKAAAATVPNAIAFLSPSHGVLGNGWRSPSGYDGGTIALTSNGGQTWHAVMRTARPVVSLTVLNGTYIAKYDDGETLQSRSGRTWRPTPLSTAGINTLLSVCPQGTMIGTNAGAADWSLCTTEPSAGNQGKAVYRDFATRGWVRVACTTFFNLSPCSEHGSGGISSYGYPVGIAGNDDGFGLIWETRGTLYVTRDGGRHWTALDKLVRPEIDFGSWAFTLRHGVGYALVGLGAGPWRLLRTTDAGRTWRVVHRWAALTR